MFERKATFDARGVTFRFVGHPGGTEEIFFQDKLLSSQRSMFGGTHQFDHDGNNYEVTVKSGMAGISFVVSVNGDKAATDNKEKTKSNPIVVGFAIVGLIFSLPIGYFVVRLLPAELTVLGGVIGGALTLLVMALFAKIGQSLSPGPPTE